MLGSVDAILPPTPDGAPSLSSQSGVHTTIRNGSHATAHANLVTGVDGTTGVSAAVFQGKRFSQLNATFATFDLRDSFAARFTGGGSRMLELNIRVDGDYAEVIGGSSPPRTSLVDIASLGASTFQYEIVGRDCNVLANPLLSFLTPG